MSKSWEGIKPTVRVECLSITVFIVYGLFHAPNFLLHYLALMHCVILCFSEVLLPLSNRLLHLVFIFGCLNIPTFGKELYILNVFSYISSGELLSWLSEIYGTKLWLHHTSWNWIMVTKFAYHSDEPRLLWYQDWYQRLNTTWSVTNVLVMHMNVELRIRWYLRWG